MEPLVARHGRGVRSATSVLLVAALLLSCVVLTLAPAPAAVAAEARAATAAIEPPAGGLVPSRSWGSEEGAFSVDNDGSASYSLPLWTPPGRGDVVPSLSLNYSSGSGNGPLGVGWSLAGPSSISPCGRTVAQDGYLDPVRFNGFDAYCLDGARLMMVGVPGEIVTEWRTEREIFARILSTGVPGAVPANFRVWTKDGKILTYGDTDESRLNAYRLSAGDSSADPTSPFLTRSSSRVTASWALRHVDDRYGNRATLNYEFAEGQESDLWYAHMRLQSITYAPNRSVQFEYESRTDDVDTFYRGVHTREFMRLSGIRMFGRATPNGDDELLRKYQLDYRDDSITGRSLLRAVTPCDGAGVCLEPLEFAWSLGSYDLEPIDTGVHDAGTSNVSGRRIDAGDFNGDGRDDILYPDDENNLRIRSGTDRGFSSFRTNGLPPRPSADTTRQWDVRPIDFDRDGRLDFMAEVQTETLNVVEYTLYRSTGVSFAAYEPDVDEDHISVGGRPDPAYWVDLDGNGLPDYVTPRAQTPFIDPVHYRLNTGAEGEDRFAPMVQTGYDPHPSAAARIKTIDSDGDGRAELLMHGQQPNDHYETFGLSRLGGVQTRPVNVLADEDGFELHFADVNGDGLEDAVYPMTGLRTQLNSGNGFGPLIDGPDEYTSPQGPWLGPADRGVRIVDFNNDGRDDVLIFHAGVPNGPGDHERGLQLYTWAENEFVRVPIEQALDREPDPDPNLPADIKTWQNTQVLDIDGNGVYDLINVEDGDPDYLQLLKRRDPVTDRLTGVSVDTVGPRAEVTYATMAGFGLDLPHAPCEGTYPVICPRQGGTIVTQHRLAAVDETGATVLNLYNHRYAGARVDLTGRGWLGFARHSVHDLQTGRDTYTDFDNVTVDTSGTRVYPYAGLPDDVVSTVEVDADTVHRTELDNQYLMRRPDVPGTHAVELLRSTSQDWEYPTGSPLPNPLHTQTTVQFHDEFGNVRDYFVNTEHGRYRHEVLTYDNDETNWLIGMLARHEVTSCIPGQVPPDGDCDTQTTTYPDYDAAGNVVETVVEPGGEDTELRTVVGRGEFGLIETVTTSDRAGRSRVQTLEYDEDKLLPTVSINDKGHQITTEYHSGLGLPTAVTDPNGIKSTMSYDGFGRQRAAYHADGSFELADHQTIDGSNRIVTTSSDGSGTLTVLDMLGREIESGPRSVDGDHALTRTTYDRFGRVAVSSRPYLPGETVNLTTYQYDNRDRVIRATEPDGSFVRTEYHGLEQHTYDALDVHSYTVMTADGDVEARYEDDPDSANWLRTRFEYGHFGEITLTEAPDGTTQTMRYDVLGRREQLIDPNLGTTTSTYTGFGELDTETDNEGRVADFDYDSLGRVERITSPDGVATKTWDTAAFGLGKLASARSTDGVVTAYTYDVRDLTTAVETTVDGTAYRIDYGHDEVARLQTITYPSVPGIAGRFSVTHDYNPYGYLREVRDTASGTRYWQLGDRDAAGQLLRETYANQVVTDYTYTVMGLLRQVETTGPGQVGVLRDLTVGRDLNDNVTGREETVQNRRETYGYDTLNRLTSWRLRHGTTVDTSTSFTYDVIGNLKTETVAGRPDRDLTYRHGEAGAPPHALTSRNAAQYTYDGVGRQITGLRRTAVYNSADQLKVLNWGQDRRTDFAYDADGARVLKRDATASYVTVAGLYERRIHTEASTLDIRNLFNVVVEGRVVAQIEWAQTAPSGPMTGTRPYYLHGDQQGSTAMVTNAAGAPVAGHLGSMYYDPFGLRIEADGDPLTHNRHGGPRQGYTSHVHDDEFGLIDMVGRIYDPELRRFLTPDPIVEDSRFSQSLNRYSYVANNPVTRTDPTGHFGRPALGWLFPMADVATEPDLEETGPGGNRKTPRRTPGGEPEGNEQQAPAGDDDGATVGAHTQEADDAGAFSGVISSGRPLEDIAHSGVVDDGMSEHLLAASKAIEEEGLDGGGEIIEVRGKSPKALETEARFYRSLSTLESVMGGAVRIADLAMTVSGVGGAAKFAGKLAFKGAAKLATAKARRHASKELTANLLKELGLKKPPKGTAAHHIVAWGSKKAESARAVLAQKGIGINDAQNGVFLPKNRFSRNPTGAAVHSRVHTDAYYDAVNSMVLSNQGSMRQVSSVLGHIRDRLLSGGFP